MFGQWQPLNAIMSNKILFHWCLWSSSPLGYLKNEHRCGRPLGLRFNKKTGDLYIADANFGLMKVGLEGGVAISLATEGEGVPLTFTNDLDIDDDGNVISPKEL